ncbi:GMP phosphodiesterase delta subunit [Carpediemonas membranifera]|uniref:GMP phosphodiesterase delta subunit n=1 Tax=Carpediemonas membranifera TaxID=201153 RepID=A0A8J6B5T7_9EUKA|nr:GMP phosphodiesterase delta subunit [Carpediemonas membranifera]|eukprot:KAG9394879.1 GMP phosphodiesterase delta subunit [Carpediemonas membranifera]
MNPDQSNPGAREAAKLAVSMRACLTLNTCRSDPADSAMTWRLVSGKMPEITPEHVNKLKEPCTGFLCEISDDIYDFDFKAFKIRDIASNEVLFNMDDSGKLVGSVEPMMLEGEDMYRGIRYHFPAKFWNMKSIGTTLTFSVGDMPVRDFRMIERHYFRGKLIHSFDFTFGFVIPNSTNQWEAIYPVPKVSKKVVADILKSPWEVKSDTFFFSGRTLIKHHRAEYAYDD